MHRGLCCVSSESVRNNTFTEVLPAAEYQTSVYLFIRIPPWLNIFRRHLSAWSIRKGINQCFIKDMNEWDNRYVAAGRDWSVIPVSLSCSSAAFSFSPFITGKQITYGYGKYCRHGYKQKYEETLGKCGELGHLSLLFVMFSGWFPVKRLPISFDFSVDSSSLFRPFFQSQRRHHSHFCDFAPPPAYFCSGSSSRERIALNGMPISRKCWLRWVFDLDVSTFILLLNISGWKMPTSETPFN